MALRAMFKSALMLISVLGVLACTPSKVSFNSVDITGADYARDLTWQDKAGLTHHLQDYKGQLALVFLAIHNAQMCVQVLCLNSKPSRLLWASKAIK